MEAPSGEMKPERLRTEVMDHLVSGVQLTGSSTPSSLIVSRQSVSCADEVSGSASDCCASAIGPGVGLKEEEESAGDAI